MLTACFSPLNVCSISYLTTIFLPSFLPVVSAELQQPQEAGRPTLFSQGALAAIQPVWYKRFVDMNQSWEILVAKGHSGRIFGTGVEKSVPQLFVKGGLGCKEGLPRDYFLPGDEKRKSPCLSRYQSKNHISLSVIKLTRLIDEKLETNINGY